jgi:hypothetical protein
LKISILLLTIGYIVLELMHRNAMQNFQQLTAQIQSGKQLYLLFIVVLLMPVNILLEASKWRFAAAKLEQMSLKRAIASVLAGMSIGIFTPNNIGDYGGRILYLKEDNRIKGVLVNFISSIGQMVITLLAGFIAFVFYAPQYVSKDPLINYIILYFILFLIVAIFYLFLNIGRISYYIESLGWLKKHSNTLSVFTKFKNIDLAKILAWSAFRYLVFSSQYLLLLYFFIPEIAIPSTYMMIALIFFTQSILPGFAITELGVRSGVAVFFLTHLGLGTLGVLAAAFSIWCLNVIFPSLLGTYFIIKAKFIRVHS